MTEAGEKRPRENEQQQEKKEVEEPPAKKRAEEEENEKETTTTAPPPSTAPGIGFGAGFGKSFGGFSGGFGGLKAQVTSTGGTGFGAFGKKPEAEKKEAVSYTHLTLPTICSV